MANTYSDATGVLIFDGPARITPVIRMLFASFKLDEQPEDSGTEHYVAVLSEDNNYDWDRFVDEVMDTAEREFGIDFEGRTAPAEVVRTIAAHFDADIADLLPSIDFDNSVLLSDVVALALMLPDGHNLAGIHLEGCWHCDRPRLWEFGGWATFASSRYFLSLATSDVSAFARSMDASTAKSIAATAKELGSFVQKLIDGIIDPGQRAMVARQLISDLKEGLSPKTAAAAAIAPSAGPSPPAWTRTVYLGAYATDDGAGPGYARLEVTPGFIHTLQALRALCKEVGLTEARISDAPEQWGPGTSDEELRLTAPELVVTPSLFWYEDVPKHMPFHIETACEDIDRFVEAVCGPGEPLYIGIDPQDVAEQNAPQS